MRLGLISGAYPPDLDGIGDYTWWLAQTLAAQPGVEGPIPVFTSKGTERTMAPGVEVIPIFDPRRPSSFRDLLNSPIIGELDWLVLQYNPFSFGRRGYCPWVPKTLVALKKAQNGLRIAVMFHETVVPCWPWKFLLMYCWQQPVFRSICRVADAAFVSTERWIPQVRRAARQLPVRHLPVGSNIPLCSDSRAQARQKLGIDQQALVLGVFGTVHISRQLDWMGATANAIASQRPETIILYVGRDGAAVREKCRDVKVIDGGVQPASMVGTYLRSMNLLLSPFSDGISTRRSSVISPLQHGVPVATTKSAWSDALFRGDNQEVLLYPDGDSCEYFVKKVMDWLAARDWNPITPSSEVTDFYKQHFTWEHIGRNLMETLVTIR